MRAIITALFLFCGTLPAMAWDGVGCVQRQLAALGFDPGAPDGRIGPATRAALTNYEAAHGTLTARSFESYSAIVHCRQLGLRHPEARALWPSAAEPYRLIAEDGIAPDFAGQVRASLVAHLKLLDETMGVALAAPPVVVIGHDVRRILALADRHLPQGITSRDIAAGLRGHCGPDETYGIAFPGIMLICAPKRGPQFGAAPYTFAYHATGHELAHEAQFQLTGAPPTTSDAAERRAYGPFWLMEGTAVMFPKRIVTSHTPSARDIVARVFAGKAPPDLKSLETRKNAKAAERALYDLGQGAARELAFSSGGIPALFRFYEGIGSGLEWPAAFEASFGISPEMFYELWPGLIRPRT